MFHSSKILLLTYLTLAFSGASVAAYNTSKGASEGGSKELNNENDSHIGCDAMGRSLLKFPVKEENSKAVLPRLLFSPGIDRSLATDKNDSKPDDIKSEALDMGQFDRALKEVQDLYQPYFLSIGKSLNIRGKWRSPEVEAVATRDLKNNAEVIVHGGLARHPWINEDALKMFVCHEVGHFLGGAPKKPRGKSGKISWSSAEGQADYFASAKCARLLFSDESENQKFVESLNNTEKQDISLSCEDYQCMRIVYAGKLMTKIMADSRGWSTDIFASTPDHSVVHQTVYGHPRLQCRLDTVVSGVNCGVNPDELFDDQDPKVGACVASKDTFGGESDDAENNVGSRPRCWYAR